MNTIQSEFMRLNSNDVVKAGVMTIIGAVLNFVYPILMLHALPTLSSTMYVALIAGVGYLIKNFFTPSQPATGV